MKLSGSFYLYFTLGMAFIMSGQAIGYFVGGKNYSNTDLWNYLVIAQFLLGIVVILYCIWKLRKLA